MNTLAIVPVFLETGKIPDILSRFEPGSVDEICLVVDHPGTGIEDELKEWKFRAAAPLRLIVNPSRKGVGHAIRQGYEYALSQGVDIIVVMAGNGKDDPSEIPRLTTPILKEGYDYVQGSRFLPGGRRERTPFLRSIFIRFFPFFWTMIVGVRCTDVTNGFRAYRASILKDPRINIWQSWLDNYELEYYLHYKVLTLGYRFAERPVSKIYRHMRRRKYSHISPFKDWWHIVGPLFLLWLGARS
jgi:dolichol-phosphate mannosyltransferase